LPTSDIIALVCFFLACFAAASSGAIFKPGAWYEGLRKPSWTPPNWLFAPAWLVFYCLIAVSGWLVWRKAGFEGAGLALTIYGIHLVINAGWSAVFFGLRRIKAAFAEVMLLWLSIAVTIAVFAPIDSTAALLLVPYLVWVTFASSLNFAILRLNPERP
jgi:benzodiazapine receptor